MTLTAMIANLRIDLKDSPADRWADADLTRHINRALAEYSRVWPQVLYVDKAGVAGQRWYDLSAQTGYQWVESVEYPIDDAEGPLYLRWRVDEFNKKVGLIGTLPTTGENIRFWYAAAHVLGAGSTIPVVHEEVVAMGAGAYAGLEWSAYTIDRINSSGWTPRQWREWSEKRLSLFKDELDRLRTERVTSLGLMVSWGSATV